MSKEYTDKIRIILDQSQQTVPYVFERFYILLKQITLSLKQQNQQQKIFQQYSLIFKTIKKYIKDEPFLIVNKLQQIQKELKTIINPLQIYLQDKALSKSFLNYFIQPQITKKVNDFINQSEKIKKQYLAKNIKIKVYGTHELSNAFWINKFKTQYAVHFDVFWNAFMEFIQQINFFERFIGELSKRSLKKRIDPQKKYYVTSTNVSEFFYKMSQPQFLKTLANQTAKALKFHEFRSNNFLQMSFHKSLKSEFETNLTQNEMFEINGNDTVIKGQIKKCKYPPTIIFGSGVDCDVKIKNKYISRKQFMIIEQEQEKLQDRLQQNKFNIFPFSLICLSSSNFTMVSYKRKYELKKGTIFKLGQSAIQVLNISYQIFQQKTQMDNSDNDQNQDEDDEQEDKTLQFLPNKTKKQVSGGRLLEYIVLTGIQKGKKGQISPNNMQLIFDDQKLTFQLKNNEFYLPSFTPIYVKTANQVINGHLSNKITIQEGMKIILQECEFQIK